MSGPRADRRGSRDAARPPHLTPSLHPRFPTRRAVGVTIWRAAVAGGAGAVLTLPGAALLAPSAMAAGRNHHTRVLRIRDPAAPGGTRNARVAFTDPAHLADRRVPVVYFLHGLPGSAADLDNSGAADRLFAAASAIGGSVVLVNPVGGSMHSGGRIDTEWGDDVAGEWQLETWVTTHLRTAVEGAAPRGVRDRVIAGFSMGGFGAAMIGLRHPGLFGSIAAIAGYFHLDDPDDVFGTDTYERIYHRPDHLVFARREQRFLLADGAQDPLPLTQGETARFAAILRDRGYPPTIVTPEGGHDLAMVAAVMPGLARFVADR